MWIRFTKVYDTDDRSEDLTVPLLDSVYHNKILANFVLYKSEVLGQGFLVLLPGMV